MTVGVPAREGGRLGHSPAGHLPAWHTHQHQHTVLQTPRSCGQALLSGSGRPDFPRNTRDPLAPTSHPPARGPPITPAQLAKLLPLPPTKVAPPRTPQDRGVSQQDLPTIKMASLVHGEARDPGERTARNASKKRRGGLTARQPSEPPSHQGLGQCCGQYAAQARANTREQ